MNIKLRAVGKTVQQLISFVLIMTGCFVVLQLIPVVIVALAMVAGLLVGLIYLVYQINLSKLRDESEDGSSSPAGIHGDW